MRTRRGRTRRAGAADSRAPNETRRDEPSFGGCLCHPEILQGVIDEAAAFLPSAGEVSPSRGRAGRRSWAGPTDFPPPRARTKLLPRVLKGCVADYAAGFGYAGHRAESKHCPPQAAPEAQEQEILAAVQEEEAEVRDSAASIAGTSAAAVVALAVLVLA